MGPRRTAARGDTAMAGGKRDAGVREGVTATWAEVAIRLALLGLLLYLAFTLVRPFITIAIWSIVLAVALYPAYERLLGWVGVRRRLPPRLVTPVALLSPLGAA